MMGEAYDERGHLLGQAVGKSKQEVLDKLMANHPDAAEVRIKKLTEEFMEKVKGKSVMDGIPVKDEATLCGFPIKFTDKLPAIVNKEIVLGSLDSFVVVGLRCEKCGGRFAVSKAELEKIKRCPLCE
jgi:hypothetical protein